MNYETDTYTDKFVLAYKPNAVLFVENKCTNLCTNIYVNHKNHYLIVTKNNSNDI